MAKLYPYGAGLMTVGSSASEKLVAVNVYSMPEHFGKERFLKDTFLLAVTDVRQRRSCISELATFGQPSNERVSHLIWMTVIRGSQRECPTDHTLIKMSSPVNMLTGLVF